MTDAALQTWLALIGCGLLLSMAGALWRVWRGPAQADRMLAAQLIGTGGIATVLLLTALTGRWAMLDVALVLALLAAFATLAFVKSAGSAAGHGDPENQPPPPLRGKGQPR